MMNSTLLLTVFIAAVTLVPCVLCLIVWGYVLAMAGFLRSATAADVDPQEAGARYGLVFHDDLCATVTDAVRRMVLGLLAGLVLLTVWYFFAAVGEQARVMTMLNALAVLSGVMWLLSRLVEVITGLMARTKTLATSRIRKALRTAGLWHILIWLLTIAACWVLTL